MLAAIRITTRSRRAWALIGSAMISRRRRKRTRGPPGAVGMSVQSHLAAGSARPAIPGGRDNATTEAMKAGGESRPFRRLGRAKRAIARQEGPAQGTAGIRAQIALPARWGGPGAVRRRNASLPQSARPNGREGPASALAA